MTVKTLKHTRKPTSKPVARSVVRSAGGGTPEIPANAVVNRDGAYVVDRDGSYIIADPTPRTAA